MGKLFADQQGARQYLRRCQSCKARFRLLQSGRSCRDAPRIGRQRIEVSKPDCKAIGCKLVDNPRPPFVWNLPTSGAPFAPRCLICAERTGNSVDSDPIEICVCHAMIMGQSVPLVKDDVSRDVKKARWHIHGMATWLSEAEFNDHLCARVQRLRIERDWTQQQMAAAIGVPFERYKKYETRSPLPAYLIPRFAQIVDRSVSYILTGRDEAAHAPRVKRLVRTEQAA